MPFSNILKASSKRFKAAFGRVVVSKTPDRSLSEESIARYCPGGYQPVRIHDTFHDGKYQVVSKLGYGLYSTVWLARNTEDNKHVALKVLTADAFDGVKDTHEIDILMHLTACARTFQSPGSNHILSLLDHFNHQGPNGNHICLVFKAMGPDLSKYRRLFPGYKLPHLLLKRITKQLLLALVYLHDTCRVIHTDIKPQNILIETLEINDMFDNAPSEVFKPICPPYDPPNDFYRESEQVTSAEEDLTEPKDLFVRLGDFGTASWFENHLTEWIQPEKLRAPEVILGAQWDHKVDIWNLGLIIWELAEAQVLFDGRETPTAPYSAAAHLAQMIAVFGSIPKDLLSRSSRSSQYFDHDGNPLSPTPFPSCSLGGFCQTFEPGSAEREDFLVLLESMLRLSPEARPDARSLLRSNWLLDT